MNCRTVRAQGAHSADPAIAQEIRDHLATCPACVDELGELPAPLIAPSAVPPPAHLTTRIMAKLPPTPQIAAQREQARMRRRWIWRLGFAACLLALMLVGSLGLLVDSSLPSNIIGGAQSVAGRAALALTLAGKPMIAMLLNSALPLLLFVGIGGSVALWSWRRLAQPLAPLVAIPLEEAR